MMLQFKVSRNWDQQRILLREYRSAWGWGWEQVRNFGFDTVIVLPVPEQAK